MGRTQVWFFINHPLPVVAEAHKDHKEATIIPKLLSLLCVLCASVKDLLFGCGFAALCAWVNQGTRYVDARFI